MVKKRKLGGSKGRKVRTAAQSGAQQQQAPVVGPPQPSHLKRRIIKKQHFLEQLERSSQAALAAKHTVTTKRKGARRAAKPLPDLSSLDDILRQVQEAPAKPAAGKKAGSRGRKAGSRGRTEQVSSTKARRLITETETTRMLQVLQHPAFAADPLAALRNHLEATLPEAPPAAAVKPAAKREPGSQKRQRKKREKREQSMPQVMES